MTKGIYTVDKILDKKIEDGKLRYLVKWVGWSKEDSTWEPLKNLKNVMNIVKEYESKNKKIVLKNDSKKITKKENKKESRFLRKRIRGRAAKVISLLDEDDTQCESDSSKSERKIIKSNKSKILAKKISKNMTDKKKIIAKKDNITLITKKRSVNVSKKSKVSANNSGEIEIKSKSSPILKKKTKTEETNSTINTENLEESNSSCENSISEKYISPTKTNEEKNESIILEGNIEFDIPVKIVSARIISTNEVMCEVEWAKRYNNSQPLNSKVSNQVLKNVYPLLLIEYYESKLRPHVVTKSIK